MLDARRCVIDIVLRLRAPLFDADARPLAGGHCARQVRADADSLLQEADAPCGAARCESGELRMLFR